MHHLICAESMASRCRAVHIVGCHIIASWKFYFELLFGNFFSVFIFIIHLAPIDHPSNIIPWSEPLAWHSGPTARLFRIELIPQLGDLLTHIASSWSLAVVPHFSDTHHILLRTRRWLNARSYRQATVAGWIMTDIVSCSLYYRFKLHLMTALRKILVTMLWHAGWLNISH